MIEDRDTIYPRQLAVLTFFVVIAYKIVMLPMYLSHSAPRDFIIGAIAQSLAEIVMFCLVYYIIFNTNIQDMYVNIWIKRIVFGLIFISSSIKFVVQGVETLDYVSSLLFQEGRWLFIILTLIPALGYISYKGVNTIARQGEILVWAVIVTLSFTLIFLDADIELDNILPLFDNGISKTIDSYLVHSMWFGDFLPFLVVSIKKKDTKLDRYAPHVGLLLTYTMMTAFFVLFVAIYGDIAPYIKYAFSNIAIYNRISNILGGVDFPIVCVWMLMAIIKLAFLLYSMRYSLEHIIKMQGDFKISKWLTIALVVAYMLIFSFAVEGASTIYAFATSYVRYIVLAIDYTLPIVLFAIVKVRQHHLNKVELIKDNIQI